MGLTIDEKTLTTKIRLTRGHVGGRAPKLACEQERKYEVGSVDPITRSFATQMFVRYLQGAGELHLAISPIKYFDPKTIAVKVLNEKVSPVSIVNTPLSHKEANHYTAFYAMVGAQNGKVIKAESCSGEFNPHATRATRPAQTPEPASPDPDCVPPGFIRS